MDLIKPEFGLLIWQTIIFLAIIFVLGKYAWKPILSGLKDREDSIASALGEAEKARTEMQKLTSDNQKLLDEARSEREKILKAAQKTADELREEAKAKASSEVNKMLEDARKVIESEKQSAIASIKEQVAILSVEVAGKILRRELENKDRQQLLAADIIRELKVN
ncbi:MAG: ATP synthase F0 subunit B [Bacteroidetes bacterium]|nr:MAG: ATP synthase F0 subunit B [Bacteroidota bacterium]TAG87798.1 MAG: ATP synthase F0 subunit B [Bacteroidota bacterium]